MGRVGDAVANPATDHGYDFYDTITSTHGADDWGYNAHPQRAGDAITGPDEMGAALDTTNRRLQTAARDIAATQGRLAGIRNELLNSVTNPSALFNLDSDTAQVIIPSHVPRKHNNVAGTIAETGITTKRVFSFPMTLRYQFEDSLLAWQPDPYFAYYRAIIAHAGVKQATHGNNGAGAQAQRQQSAQAVASADTLLRKYEPTLPAYVDTPSTDNLATSPWYLADVAQALRYEDKFFTKLHVGTSGLGAEVDASETYNDGVDDQALRVGMQQETAVFRVFAERQAAEDPDNAGQVKLDTSINVRDLMDLTTIVQLRENTTLSAGDAAAEADDNTPDWEIGRRHRANGKRIMVTSVGEMDNELYHTGDIFMPTAPPQALAATNTRRQQAAIQRNQAWIGHYGHGNATTMRTAYKSLQKVNNDQREEYKENGIEAALDNWFTPNAGAPVRVRDRVFAYTKLIAPQTIRVHNERGRGDQIGVTITADAGQNVFYLADTYFEQTDKPRRYFFEFSNLTNQGDDGTRPRTSCSVITFTTADCEPMLFWDETHKFSNVVTRVTNAQTIPVWNEKGRQALNDITGPDLEKHLDGTTLQTIDKHFWAHAFGDQTMTNATNQNPFYAQADVGNAQNYAAVLAGLGPNAETRTRNATIVMMVSAPPAFDDAYWQSDPFAQQRLESKQAGPVFRSRVRVSQHLCAPILNPNRRIGCSAPLNYDTLHLPPELRNFRIRLEDVAFTFLPNRNSYEIEPLVLYEFNGGTQDPGNKDSLLYMPHFRSHSVTATGQRFETSVFSPYGNPSYIALFARDPAHENEWIKQPLIKSLTIRSATTHNL